MGKDWSQDTNLDRNKKLWGTVAQYGTFDDWDVLYISKKWDKIIFRFHQKEMTNIWEDKYM
jgi:hypothetical protein